MDEIYGVKKYDRWEHGHAHGPKFYRVVLGDTPVKGEQEYIARKDAVARAKWLTEVAHDPARNHVACVCD